MEMRIWWMDLNQAGCKSVIKNKTGGSAHDLLLSKSKLNIYYFIVKWRSENQKLCRFFFFYYYVANWSASFVTEHYINQKSLMTFSVNGYLQSIANINTIGCSIVEIFKRVQFKNFTLIHRPVFVVLPLNLISTVWAHSTSCDHWMTNEVNNIELY